MKAVFAIVGVVVVLILLGTVMVGIKKAQTTERTDSFATVTTGGGDFTAPVVLVADLFDHDILNVTSISSDNVADAPLPYTYTPGTKTLVVRGLAASDTRNITVTYDYGSMTGQFSSASTFLKLIPLFIGIALLLIVVGVGVAAIKGRN